MKEIQVVPDIMLPNKAAYYMNPKKRKELRCQVGIRALVMLTGPFLRAPYTSNIDEVMEVRIRLD